MFFFWGFVASANDVLIPVFKEKLQLQQWQSQFVSFVFYVAYTSGTVLYLIISKKVKTDLLYFLGYRKGLFIGLLIAFTGTLFFFPASAYGSFVWMLSGLYVIGLGFSLMQTAANALIIYLGEPAKSSQRLSLAGGVNNIGSTLGPFILSYFLVKSDSQIHLSGMYVPYLLMGTAFLTMAIWLKKSSIPERLNAGSENNNILSFRQIWLNKKIIFSMLAIFIYVGVEVSTVSNFPELLIKEYGKNQALIPAWVALYWAGLMMGRWADSSQVLFQKKAWQTAGKILFPFLAFGFYYAILILSGKPMDQQLYFLPFILLFVVIDFASKGNPNRQLVYYALTGALCLGFVIFLKNIMTIYLVVLAGMFCSTLWPCIFSVALRDFKENPGSVSVWLIMMIMGGGIISLLQGWLASIPIGGMIRYSYTVGIICFIYLAWYGYKFQNNPIKD
jgi:FHS family L-fucose permease-like MFS transporter